MLGDTDKGTSGDRENKGAGVASWLLPSPLLQATAT